MIVHLVLLSLIPYSGKLSNGLNFRIFRMLHLTKLLRKRPLTYIRHTVNMSSDVSAARTPTRHGFKANTTAQIQVDCYLQLDHISTPLLNYSAITNTFSRLSWSKMKAQGKLNAGLCALLYSYSSEAWNL